jgi:hypothetical protein
MTGLITALALVAAAPGAGEPFDAEDADQSALVLSIAFGKQRLVVGDEVVVTFRLANRSGRAVRIHRDPQRFLVMKSAAGATCPIDGAQVGEGEPVTVGPGKALEERLVGRVSEGKGFVPRGRLKREGRTEVSGLFLDFPIYRVFLGSQGGAFEVQGTYQTLRHTHRSSVVRVEIARRD